MRPEGWDELVKKHMPDETSYDPDPMLGDKAFEAGADALLEGLELKGQYYELDLPDGVRDVMISYRHRGGSTKGYLVFIEE